MISSLPDISSELTVLPHPYPLDWVGMENIALPLKFENAFCNSKVNAFVSLDIPHAKGIHMSRLYTRLLQLTNVPSLKLLDIEHVLQDFLSSHLELSHHSKLDISSELYLERPALVSQLSGWRSYPFSISTQYIHGQFQTELTLEIAYSSTCPCSAALSRSLIQKQFIQAIADQNISLDDPQKIIDWLGTTDAIVATPHSQRSFATLKFRLSPKIQNIPFVQLIDHAEQALSTALQTAVKRIDEQALEIDR
ncbi:GTP cyclohydrolase FolE2 [Acinetobacter stercoris]|uniref:GTP cyclohydrolase FolE2 n=1 Tax=Acinetobacter stercoris TaxID=2126983 RepID=A0A2U3N356_9GAMM|nr:GTP cyclohydrolase FolE2 [Acinetobacter stercoris]